MEFQSLHDNTEWILTNVYGPCTPEGKLSFLHWLKRIQMPDEVDWLVVGDFNLLRNPGNRNRPGGNLQDMLLFNEAISAQGWVELPLQGRKYTWSNKQNPPLLERLDWFFTSNSWTLSYPNTAATALVMEPSDHAPCLVSIATTIPKGHIFRFENYRMKHEHVLDVMAYRWSVPTFQSDIAKKITAKFKKLRRVLRAWQGQLSSLKANIENVKIILQFLEVLEDFRDLTIIEWNFRILLRENMHLF